MLAFGFTSESYFASIGLYVWLFICSIDIFLRLLMRYKQRSNEIEADLFAAEAGFGISIKNSLIRNNKANLSILYKSEFDNIVYGSHPTLQARLAAVENEMENRPELREKAENNLTSMQKLKVELSDDENEPVPAKD